MAQIPAPKLFIYGERAAQKSAFACESTNPIVLDFNGQYTNPDVVTIEKPSLKNYESLSRTLNSLLKDMYVFKTLVLDSVTSLQDLLLSELEKECVGIKSLDTAIDHLMCDFLSNLDKLRHKHNMTIIFIHHMEANYIAGNNPYVSYFSSLGVANNQAPLSSINSRIKEWLCLWCDYVLYADDSFLYTTSRNPYNYYASSKTPLPPEMPLEFNNFIQHLMDETT